jgi:DNA invertase Pin-like site-specific DNA recombinase
LRDLIDIPQALKERGIGLRPLRENLDTTTPGGKLVFHVFGALAEWERDVIRERTFAGLDAARARGRMGGRPRVMDEAKIRNARSMMVDPDNSVDDVCRILGVSRSTLYKYLREGRDGEERDRPTPE